MLPNHQIKFRMENGQNGVVENKRYMKSQGSSVELVCKRDPKQFPEPLSSDTVLFDTCFVCCLEGVTLAINTGNISAKNCNTITY